MSGSTNLLPFNPQGQNQETDAQYSVDTLRTGGFANPSIVPSALLNKTLYQLSTFMAAFAQALAVKGYTVTDASLQNLAGVLANVMTEADMSPYATLQSPTFTGTPTAPTPAAGDSSAKLATTAFLQNAFPGTLSPAGGVNAYTNSGDSWTRLPNGLLLVWGTFVSAPNIGAYLQQSHPFPAGVVFKYPPFVLLNGMASANSTVIFSPGVPGVNLLTYSVNQASGNTGFEAIYLALGS